MDKNKIENKIIEKIKDLHKTSARYFSDSKSVDALFCDALIEYEDFIKDYGYPLFDNANRFGELYFSILERLLLNKENDEIGNIIFSELTEGKNSRVRSFLASIIECAMQSIGLNYSIFKWHHCPICGHELMVYDNKCPGCGTHVDDFENVEKEIKNDIDSLSKKSSNLDVIDKIKRKPYYINIKRSAEFYELKKTLDKTINSKIKEWNKKRKRRRLLTIFPIVLCLGIVVSVFITELAGVLPISIVLAPIVKEYSYQENMDGTLTIIDGPENERHLEIPEITRNEWDITPKNISRIGDSSFRNNRIVEAVTLPKTIESIGKKAFYSCTNLKTVVLNSGKPPKIESDSFEYANEDIVFYVPEVNYEAYLANSDWNLYDDVIFPNYGNDFEHGCILFDSNGGSIVDNIKTHAYNTVVNLDYIPKKIGFTFEGWFYNKNGIEKEFVMGKDIFTRSLKLTAKWSPAKYIVEFDYNGGIGNTSSIEVTYGGEFGELPIAEKQGYVFSGWEDSSGKLVTKDTIISTTIIKDATNGIITLKARWTANVYNFEFINLSKTIATRTISTGQELPSIIPSSPESGVYSSGYSFVGWSLSMLSDGNGNENDIVEWNIIPPELGQDGETIKLYAIWATTPEGWFEFDMIDGKLFIVSLTSNWENYNSGYLNKNYLYLPENIGTQKLYGIYENAFKDRDTIEFISIPDSVEWISNYAFSGCKNLSTVAGGRNITHVGKNAFNDTYWYNNHLDDGSWFLSLGKVLIKYNSLGGTNIDESFFPESATVLGCELFKNLEKGTITIPNRITSILDEAFMNSNFEEITLPANAKYGSDVFKGVTTINKLTLRNEKFDFSSIFDSENPVYIKTMFFESWMTKNLEIKASQNINVGTLYALKMGLTSANVTGFKMTTLDLTGNNLTTLDISDIQATRLMLSGNKFTNITCNKINEAVKIIYMPSDGDQNNNKLTNLDFAKNLPNLWSLDVVNNNISDISGLANLTNLRELYLGGNPALNSAAQLQILSQCSFLPNLVRLNLGGGSQTKAILDVVAKCTNLEWLQIYDIGATASQITSAISQATHSKLKYIKISHNGLTSIPDGLKYISTVVIDYYDTAQEDVNKN